MLAALSKFNRMVETLIKPIISIALLAITCILCFNVVARYIFGFSLKWAEELANYTIIYITFLGAVSCLPIGMHISMDAIVDKLSDKGKFYLSKVNSLIGLIFSFVMAFYGYQLVGFVIERGQVSPAMMVPMVIPYMAIPTASVLLCLEFLEALLKKPVTLSGEVK